MLARIWSPSCLTAAAVALCFIGCDHSEKRATSSAEQVPQHERLPIEGRWRDGEFDLIVADGRLTTLKNGESFEYPNGQVTDLKPGFLRLQIDSTYQETLHYEWDGERLMMIFERSGPVYCNPVDKKAQQSARQLRPNKARLDNPLPRREAEIAP